MATRSCPECGAQYVATVRRCIDCDVMLVDDAGPVADGEVPGSGASPVGSGDQVGYELEGWGNQLKVTLEGMLVRAGIGRVWEAGALVVSAADEDAVDDLIATLEGDDLPELSDEARMVALEIEGLDADGHAELDARLLAGSVAHAWDDEGALVVSEADEDRVLTLIGEVLDGPAVDGDDGLAATDALSTLYVTVDRLAKHPHDRKPATAYVAAAKALDGLTVPYGFATSDWDDLVAEVDALAAAVRPHADVSSPTTGSGDDADRADDDADDDDDDDDDATTADPADVDETGGDETGGDETRTVPDTIATGTDEAAGTGQDQVAADVKADDDEVEHDLDDLDPDDPPTDDPDLDDLGKVAPSSDQPDRDGALDRDRAAARALRLRLADLV